MSSAVLWRKLCNQQRPPATSRLGVLSWKQILQPQSSLHMTAAQANFLTVTFWDTLGQNHPAKPFRTPNTQETLWGATCLLLWLLSFRGILCSNRCNRYKVLDRPPPLLVWQVKKKKKRNSPKDFLLVTFIQLLVHLNGEEKALCYFYHLVLSNGSQPSSVSVSSNRGPRWSIHGGQVCVHGPHVRHVLLHMLVFCPCFFGEKSWRKACIDYFSMSGSMIDTVYFLRERRSKSTPKLLTVLLSSKREVVT